MPSVLLAGVDPFLVAVDQACSSGAELLAGLLIDILVLPGWGSCLDTCFSFLGIAVLSPVSDSLSVR